MSNQSIYISISDIQDFMIQYNSLNNRNCLFSYALESLYHLGKYKSAHTKDPDFESWDVSDKNMLWDIYLETYLEVNAILSNPSEFSSFVSEEYIGFESRDIIPNILTHHEDAVLHSHDYFEIAYAMNGEADICINMNHTIMKNGDLIIISSQTEHMISAHDDAIIIVIALKKSTFTNAFFNVFNRQDILSIFFQNCLYSEKSNYLVFNVPSEDNICEIIKKIFVESNSKKKCSNEISCCYLSILFGMIQRSYSQSYLLHSDENTALSQMSAILTYLKSNYKTISVKSLAKFWGYEPGYLGKQIYHATGLHVNDIINTLKIDEACKLLNYSSMNIDAIAQETGFNSIQHFSRTFKKYKGISPTNYKKNKAHAESTSA